MVFLGWGRGCLDCQLQPEKEVMLKEKQRKLKLVMKETRSTMPSQKVEQYHTLLFALHLAGYIEGIFSFYLECILIYYQKLPSGEQLFL